MPESLRLWFPLKTNFSEQKAGAVPLAVRKTVGGMVPVLCGQKYVGE